MLAALLSIGACNAKSAPPSERNAQDVFNDPVVATLAQAACEGDNDQISRLIANGARVDGVGEQDVTPLMWALRCRNAEGLQALLEAGADPNQKAAKGMTATLAAVNYKGPFLKIMLDHGGDVNAVWGDGETSALHAALQQGAARDDWNNFFLLLERGVDVNFVPPNDAFTVAEDTMTFGRPSKALVLLEHGYNHNLWKLWSLNELNSVPKDSPEAEAKEKLSKILIEHKPKNFEP